MIEEQYEYLCTDEDGYTFKIKYVGRFCGCSMVGCTEDTLHIYDHNGEEEGRITLEGDCKPFMLSLLAGDLEVLAYE